MFKNCASIAARFVRLEAHSATYRVRSHVNLTHARAFSSEMIANWPPGIKAFLQRQNIESPTDIQKNTLPLIMNNRDIVGVARTGSGKTLAFVIPAVMKILSELKDPVTKRQMDPNLTGPTCLVLAPTRELAHQTADVFAQFRNLGIRSIALVGGASRSTQVQLLSDMQFHVYVATPGRLQDLVDDGIADLSKIKYLVLDEADRMLDMGFEPQLRKIVAKIPNQRQTLMYSATWPEEIQHLADDFLTNYERVFIDSETLKANPNIKQLVHCCRESEKIEILLKHLRDAEEKQQKCLIFVNTKRLADTLMFRLMKERIKSVTMHGNKSQRQRDDSLRIFKQGRCKVMIASDVAARGLDISDISLVINFDLPNNIEDYIHRIGRTARHEKEGTAVSLLTPQKNMNIVPRLIQVLEETNQDIPPQLSNLVHRRSPLKFYN